jgi:iron transport multicopper oxidase
MAAFAAHTVQLEDHKMTIIAVDGVNVVEQEASSIYIAAAQRYDVLFTAKDSSPRNYAFVSAMDLSMFDHFALLDNPPISSNATGYLVYNPTAPLPQTLSSTAAPFDDFQLVAYDRQRILPPADHSITINMDFEYDQNGIQRFGSGSLSDMNQI